jgi:hypothetical protein
MTTVALSRRTTRPRPRAVTIVGLIAVNALWALGCLLALATEPLAGSAPGTRRV